MDNGILLRELPNGRILIREHLYRTEDDRVVHENDLDGRWRCYPKGAIISREEAERFGLIEKSNLRPEANKARKPSEKK